MKITQSLEFARQQQILKNLGYYHDVVDGFWGSKAIAAKREFENSPKFAPAFPNGGLPWENGSPLPRTMYVGPDGLLRQNGIDPDRYDKMLSQDEVAELSASHMRTTTLTATDAVRVLAVSEAAPMPTKQRPYMETDIVLEVTDLLSEPSQ